MSRLWTALALLALTSVAQAHYPGCYPCGSYPPGPVNVYPPCYPAVYYPGPYCLPPCYVAYPCCPPPVYYYDPCWRPVIVDPAVAPSQPAPAKAPEPPQTPKAMPDQGKIPKAAPEPTPPKKPQPDKEPAKPKSSDPKIPPAKPLAAADKDREAPEGWCHITGRVVFEGERIPERKEIPKSGGAYTEDWVVNPKNRGVQNVVVWFAPEPTPEGWGRLKATGENRLREFPGFREDQLFPGIKSPPKNFFVHAGSLRAFVPHVLAVRGGSDLVIQNASPVPINAKWVSRNNGERNSLIPPGGSDAVPRLIPERFPIAVEDTIHPWMKAYLWVFSHPYFAVTDEDGNFEIKFAPAGKLRVFAWQGMAGYRNGREGRFGEPIEVPSGRKDLGELKFKAER